MTRIIGGTAGGRRLEVPSGRETRPTSDRVREAIFSVLESRDVLDGVAVLDAYAGSGALGLEAASRGAASVVCVESHRPTARLIERNAKSLGLPVDVVAATVADFAGRETRRFGLILADPPYPMTEPVLAADLASLAGVAEPGALLVVERSSRSPEPTWPAGVEVEVGRRYGETTVWLAWAAYVNEVLG
ncbi:16S rRNA (guanine(966)-N(2))-methyltransferase RsmD [Nostocoides jenkinsii]|jgi:16S rRNA (guanine966-N2)-methyltransferase|uniref:Putative methyltransferase n=1 Tax=Nostocoides jenkinsii Ben 74 TaxID=1193518 RepID=A0A077MD05_9MICO|nr:16S rRNA (guanine(966)-N(2))-methyltransferase RsmD [Tetrasphaera jenkinsii]CCI54459.1 putative methyltransferase [Tetrasphaera jenkinsii Ben 74]